jgi:hypothetical protein
MICNLFVVTFFLPASPVGTKNYIPGWGEFNRDYLISSLVSAWPQRGQMFIALNTKKVRAPEERHVNANIGLLTEPKVCLFVSL